MSVILHSDASVHVSVSIFGLLRYVELPNTRSIAPRISALMRNYSRLVGKELSYPDAINVLDRIVADRDDVPFPAAYSRIADYLIRSDYENETIHLIIGYLRRTGDVASCGLIGTVDREAIADLMPRSVAVAEPSRYSRPDWEADDEDCGCGR